MNFTVIARASTSQYLGRLGNRLTNPKNRFTNICRASFSSSNHPRNREFETQNFSAKIEEEFYSRKKPVSEPVNSKRKEYCSENEEQDVKRPQTEITQTIRELSRWTLGALKIGAAVVIGVGVEKGVFLAIDSTNIVEKPSENGKEIKKREN